MRREGVERRISDARKKVPGEVGAPGAEPLWLCAFVRDIRIGRHWLDAELGQAFSHLLDAHFAESSPIASGCVFEVSHKDTKQDSSALPFPHPLPIQGRSCERRYILRSAPSPRRHIFDPTSKIPLILVIP